MKDIVTRCINSEPRRRPTVQEALKTCLHEQQGIHPNTFPSQVHVPVYMYLYTCTCISFILIPSHHRYMYLYTCTCIHVPVSHSS